ncbi:hypothetical protein Hanom_Chr06g00523951 [Helianthus anomalus]
MIFKLDDFISRLESEMHKIDAFKRVLPLCMPLNNDVYVVVIFLQMGLCI